MGIFQITLILVALLCSLAASLLFAFASVVMPGIGTLKGHQFLRGFQVTDRVIQDNQALFMLVCCGFCSVDLSSVHPLKSTNRNASFGGSCR